MTAEKLQNLTLGTLQRSNPFTTPFTPAEAGHILRLFGNPAAAAKVQLKQFSHEGGDGEIFYHAAIRMKGDAEYPKRFRRVYQAGYIYLGFLMHPPEALAFIKEAQGVGIEVDSFLAYLANE